MIFTVIRSFCRIYKIFFLWIIIGLLFYSCNNSRDKTYMDPTRPIEERVQDLLQRMTLEEKVQQLYGITDVRSIRQVIGKDTVGLDPLIKKVKRSGVGWIHMQNGNCRDYVRLVNACQRKIVKGTRLGIPVLVVAESLHGLMSEEGTVFPSPLAMGSTFDTTLIQKDYAVMAREARARGTTLVLSPVLDVGQDPRWGRQEETYGEDPWLNGKIGRAAVMGFQGDQKKIPRDKVAVCMKHFAGHGASEGGNYSGPVQADDRTMHQVHLRPFKMVLDRVDAAGVMITYNPVNGIPLCVNHTLVTDVLKKRWDFRGVAFSDGGAVAQLYKIHHVATDPYDAAVKAMLAGVDNELGHPPCYENLEKAVKQGAVSMARLDDAVARILRVKFRMGLFEHPYTDTSKTVALTHTEKALRLAQKTAEEAIVLLKNKDHILPVTPKKYHSIAVIGPMSDRVDYGAYSIARQPGITPLEGIRERAGSDYIVRFAKGCRIGEKEHLNFFDWQDREVRIVPDKENEPLIKQAVEIARQSDLVLLFIGEYSYFSGETWTHHTGDKADLDLLGSQKKLLEALLKTGKPVVGLQFTSGARAYVEPAEKLPALLQCWYLGEMNGRAVARILFGDISPGGKLPVSLPRSAGQLPVYYYKVPIARPGYALEKKGPLFPFGYGLSYTDFSYDRPVLLKDTIRKGETALLTCRVTNTGKFPGDEVVQLYIRDLYATGVTRPVKELRDFARIHLAPGESRKVMFRITPEMLSYYTVKNRWDCEPGDFLLMAGSSSVETDTCRLTLLQ